MTREREYTTKLMAELAFGDPLYGSATEMDAALDRQARRDRWMRRKGRK